jgi:hypothetical protein
MAKALTTTTVVVVVVRLRGTFLFRHRFSLVVVKRMGLAWKLDLTKSELW